MRRKKNSEYRFLVVEPLYGFNDAPRDIASTVEGLCAPLLEPMRAYSAQEGYGEATADAYVEQVMADNLREAEDVVVRVRTEARKSP